MCNKLIYLISVVLAMGFIGLHPSYAQDEVDNILENGGFELGDLTAWGGGGDVGSVMTVVSTLVGGSRDSRRSNRGKFVSSYQCRRSGRE
jgi:hypothetical protein